MSRGVRAFRQAATVLPKLTMIVLGPALLVQLGCLAPRLRVSVSPAARCSSASSSFTWMTSLCVCRPLVRGYVLGRLGQEVWVLPEKIMPSSSRYEGLMHCRAENYLPVLVDSQNLQIGQWLKVALIEIVEEYMLARSE